MLAMRKVCKDQEFDVTKAIQKIVLKERGNQNAG